GRADRCRVGGAQKRGGHEVDRRLAPAGALHTQHPTPVPDQCFDRPPLVVPQSGRVPGQPPQHRLGPFPHSPPDLHRLFLSAAVDLPGQPWACSVPSRTVTARPVSRTRSPATVTSTRPPRADAWKPTVWERPSRAAQYGASAVCAEPVTGSSGTPTAGAKNRDTKSWSAPGSAAAVTITPRIPSRTDSARTAARSGVSARTAAASASTTSRSPREPVGWTATGSAPRAAANPSGAGAGCGATVAAGKSRVTGPSGWACVTSTPLRLANRTVPGPWSVASA